MGICSGILNRDLLQHFPTAVASVVLKFPILKSVIGMFGLISASKSSLTRHTAKGKSFVLYPGGIAELFLASPKEEVIYCRKGFIKVHEAAASGMRFILLLPHTRTRLPLPQLALSTGTDVIPVYLFGNTTVLQVFKHPLLVKLSRSLGASLTLFWGRFGLPLPLPIEGLYARGLPMGLPTIAEPTDADVDEWHAKYVVELCRLFETYKGMRADFKDKTLRVEDDKKRTGGKRASEKPKEE